eukprot:281190_1
MTTLTPVRTQNRASRRSVRKPKTPKDVRELDRNEMIEYLQTYDDEIPTDVDDWNRASLKKRVIHCMKKQNQNTPPMINTNMPQQKLAQSAFPVTAVSRVTRKRKAELPLSGNRNKRIKTNMNENEAMQRLLPITTLMQKPTEHEQKDEDLDISSLKINFDFSDNSNSCMILNNDEMINKLLNAVKKGIPARYDIIQLLYSIVNVNHNTPFLRSTKMQKLFEKCLLEQEIHCSVRTSDDVYALSNDDMKQIEDHVSEWIHKYGQYSSTIHPSIYQNSDNKLEAKDYIFQYEVLGRLIGDEMTEDEYYHIYSGTFDEYRRSLHSWVFELHVPIIDENSDCNDLKYDQYDMLVDCIGKNNTNYSKLLLIEDCRSDLTKCVTTKEDLTKENVLFVTIEINGWPSKWAIAKRNINKSEQLFGHFGDGYGSLRKQVTRQQQSVELFVSSIASFIQRS